MTVIPGGLGRGVEGLMEGQRGMMKPRLVINL